MCLMREPLRLHTNSSVLLSFTSSFLPSLSFSFLAFPCLSLRFVAFSCLSLPFLALPARLAAFLPSFLSCLVSGITGLCLKIHLLDCKKDFLWPRRTSWANMPGAGKFPQQKRVTKQRAFLPPDHSACGFFRVSTLPQHGVVLGTSPSSKRHDYL